MEPAAPQPEEEEEAEVYNPPPEEVVDEEQPVPEVINEVPNNVAPVVATTVAPVSQEEAPKKSYASIVGFSKATSSYLNSICCSCTCACSWDDTVSVIILFILYALQFCACVLF